MDAHGGAYLRGLRKRRALNLDDVVQELAHRYRIRVARSTLSRYETGSRTHPDSLLLWGLAQVYEEPLEQIIAGFGGRRDLTRHDGQADSTDAAPTSARDIDLAGRLERVAYDIANVVLALRGEAQSAGAPASTRHRVRRKAG